MTARNTDVVIIGAGQAGLAMSYELNRHGIEHVLLERGRVAERWRSERWDSLRLLTPNWMSRLPGYRYEGPDPDGYMTMPETVTYLERYALLSGATVENQTTVYGVNQMNGKYRVQTNRGVWRSKALVIATGFCDQPAVPPMASRISPEILQLTPGAYKSTRDLPEGGVLVVGASASGVQLADEIQASGRQVTLAIGHHTRLPRRYRGRDILYWLDRMGVLDQTPEQVQDIDASRHQPSFQLIGRPDHATLGLLELVAHGVRVVGR